MTPSSLQTRLTTFKDWLAQSKLNSPTLSVPLANAAIVQQSAILAQGDVLEIPHARDTKLLRLVTLTEGASVAEALPLIPLMSGASSPECILSASSEYPTREAWLAANRTVDSAWESNGATSAWWRCQFTQPQMVHSYTLSARSAYGDGGPRDWQFRGSHDGENWEVLDTHNSVSWVNSEHKDFTLATPATFTYFDIFMTASNRPDYAAPLLLGEVQFFGGVPTQSVVASPLDYQITLLDNLTRITRLTPAPQSRRLTVTVRL